MKLHNSRSGSTTRHQRWVLNTWHTATFMAQANASGAAQHGTCLKAMSEAMSFISGHIQRYSQNRLYRAHGPHTSELQIAAWQSSAQNWQSFFLLLQNSLVKGHPPLATCWNDSGLPSRTSAKEDHVACGYINYIEKHVKINSIVPIH